MTEATTMVDDCTHDTTLSIFTSAFNLQDEILSLDNNIKSIKKKIGLSAMEKDLKCKKEELQLLCESLVSQGIIEEGSFRILDEGKSMRIIDPDRLKEYSTSIYLQTMEFPVTKVEKAIISYLISEGMDEEEAISQARNDTNSLSNIDRKPKYSIINMEVE